MMMMRYDNDDVGCVLITDNDVVVRCCPLYDYDDDNDDGDVS